MASGLVLGIILIGRLSLETNRDYQRQTLLHDGMQTCFARVHQSFTAKMLGDTRNGYLDRSFMDTTSRCFGEAVHLAERSFGKTVPDFARDLNALATEVHIFHDRLTPKSSSLTGEGEGAGPSLANIGSRFEKLERMRDKILTTMDRRGEKLKDTISTMRGSFYVLAFCLIVFFMFELTFLRKEAKVRAEIEGEALGLLENEDMSTMRVQDVIRRALEHGEYTYCEALFGQFHHYQTKVQNDVAFKSLQPAEATPQREEVYLDERMEKVWQQADRPESGLVVYDDMFAVDEKHRTDELPQLSLQERRSGVDLSSSVEKVIEHLSGQLSTTGLRLELNIDEEIKVKGEQEAIEYLVFQAALFLVNESSTQENCVLNIDSRRLGNVAVMQMELDGKGFSNELIQSQLGLRNFNEGAMPVDWKICLDLAQTIDAKVSIDNLYADDGRVAGGAVKITFRQGEVISESRDKRIQKIEKGTKKEILERIKTASF